MTAGLIRVQSKLGQFIYDRLILHELVRAFIRNICWFLQLGDPIA